MRSKFVILFALTAVTLGMSACSNTFHGAGKDMENMGRTMQETF